MQPSERIAQYCKQVGDQIRWKKARPILTDEIKNHLCDQRDAYMADGEDESSATQKAVMQMGDAVSIGRELDQMHHPKSQRLMIALTGILMLLGVSANYFIGTTTDSGAAFSLAPYLLALGLFLCCYYMDFTVLGRHGGRIYGLVLATSLLAVTLGRGANSGRTWSVGGFAVPLSYLSLIFPLAFALFVYRMRSRGARGLVISGIAYFPLAFVLGAIPTISGFVLYTIAALTVLCFAVCRGWFGVEKKRGLPLALIPAATAIFLLGLFLIRRSPHRFIAFFNPEQDRMGAGYVYCVLRDLLSEAVLFGRGGIPQNGTEIAMPPNISTDYALAYLTHQLGFVVLIGIALLLLCFSVVALRKALREKSALGSLIAWTAILTVILQSAFYLLDNLGCGLFSSLSLPFVSYGKTALFLDAALVGCMLSVFRTGEIFRDDREVVRPAGSKGKFPLFSYEEGTLIIRLSGKHS